MTPTLKEQLEQWIYAEAMKHDDNTTFTNGGSFIAGAHSILPMLLVALECLNKYKDSAFKVNGQIFKVGSKAEEALNKIKSMMEGNGNG